MSRCFFPDPRRLHVIDIPDLNSAAFEKDLELQRTNKLMKIMQTHTSTALLRQRSFQLAERPILPNTRRLCLCTVENGRCCVWNSRCVIRFLLSNFAQDDRSCRNSKTSTQIQMHSGITILTSETFERPTVLPRV